MLSQPASQPALLVCAFRGYEDRIVAGQRRDDLRPTDMVERDGDALCGADLGHDHQQIRSGRSDVENELCDTQQRFAVANLGSLWQAVADLLSDRPQIP